MLVDVEPNKIPAIWSPVHRSIVLLIKKIYQFFYQFKKIICFWSLWLCSFDSKRLEYIASAEANARRFSSSAEKVAALGLICVSIYLLILWLSYFVNRITSDKYNRRCSKCTPAPLYGLQSGLP